jgi:hypothetical protein
MSLTPLRLTLSLTLSFVMLMGFAGVALAGGVNERLDIAQLRRDPEAFAGRIVEVQARVIAINADGRSLVLFDSPSHTRVSVELAQLPETERTALLSTDVRQVVVRGRASIVEGRLTIQAQSVLPLVSNSETERDQ